MLFKSGLAALSKSPSVLTGLVIAVVAMFLFSLTHTSVRLMSDTMTAFQIVFWRMLLSMAMLMPWYAWQGFSLLKTRRPGMHALRAAVNCGGMLLWFFAIAVVPLGKAVAIHFVLPIFVMVLAVIVLRERVGIRRISAALVGFGGVLLVLRPNEFGIGSPSPFTQISLFYCSRSRQQYGFGCRPRSTIFFLY